MTLLSHLQTGLTTICRAWAVTRTDGVSFGFTDHDNPLSFDGITFAASSGLTARTVDQSTGLSVDNTEALGVLTADAITATDIDAGRYDGAEVRFWLVNWADVSQRQLEFRGTIGEIRRNGAEFQAELRGLTEALNQPRGRVYQRDCPAVLGDSACGVDLSTHSVDLTPVSVLNRVEFSIQSLTQEAGYFTKGSLQLLDGPAKGLIGLIKSHEVTGTTHTITLWEPIRAQVTSADRIRLIAGCDKRLQTCSQKFSNISNFRGFPDIPGDDWLIQTPLRAGVHDGGSLR